MDELTLRYYSEEAKNISDKYNNVSSGLQKYFSTVFVEGMKILDIGCGSGRDMGLMLLQRWSNMLRKNIPNCKQKLI